MTVYNGKGGHIGKTTKVHRCDGCGRVIPKGSLVTMWSVWLDGMRTRVRFCSDCRNVVYGCPQRRSIDIRVDLPHICRSICESCDEYPFCDKVDYQRDSEPGDMFFGDLPIV